MTVVPRRSSIIAAPAAVALRCLLFLAVVSFGMGGPVRSQERDQLQLRPQAAPEFRDILILRSGGYEQGELTGCSSESCSLGGKSHRRDDIVLIGLGIASSDPPPAIEDPLQDSIHLRSATVLKTKLLGINAHAVVSGQGSNPRRDVAWVYLAPPNTERSDQSRHPTAPSRTDTTVEGSTYLWEGRIEVENVSEGTSGWHAYRGKWQAIYLVKFLEKWIRDASSVQNLSGQSFRINEIVPLEMSYTIQADGHEWHVTRRTEDVFMRGRAAGKMTGDKLKDALVGRVLRFEAPPDATVASGNPQPRSFASWKEFQEFETRFVTAHRQGCYLLSIAFTGKGQPPKEVRALYHGINRSGSLPIRPDPDRDFLRFVPAFMPAGTNVYGCLERPEQREAKGELVFPIYDSLDGSQISIKWSFLRSVCRDASTCGTAPSAR